MTDQEVDANGEKRLPLCASCRHRHRIGQSMAYEDDEGLYRCPRCNTLIDIDGECRMLGCCGNVWSSDIGSQDGER